MKHLFLAAALGLACAACQPDSSPAQATPPARESTPPGAPGAAAPSPTTGAGGQASAPPPGQAAKAEAGDLVPGIPTCSPGDMRTPIPVWKPAVDAHNNVDSAPPQQQDQVVLIAMEVHGAPECSDSETNLFRLTDGQDPSGALEIGVHGNTQEVDGVCHLTGLYRTKLTEPPADGTPPQGQPRVQFDAADASEIASGNTYCVQRP